MRRKNRSRPRVRNTSRRFAASSIAALILASHSVANAQPSEEPGDEAETPTQSAEAEAGTAIERARQHMERGQALYLQARFEEAATEFEAAYAARPFSAFLYNAGVSLERAGQAARAADYFERFAEAEPSSDEIEQIRTRIARLRAAAAQSTSEPPRQEMPESVPDEFKSLLSIRTNPEGATIIVMRESEEVTRGPAPFAHTLNQGRYTLRVEHPDFQTVEQAVTIEPGKVYVVIVEMSQGQFLGYLRVQSNVPGAEVFVDDRELGARGHTPFEAPIPVGTHRIWVERPGYEPVETETEVGIGEDRIVRVELERVEYGRIRVVANLSSAGVYVDNVHVGPVPYEGQVSAGAHTISVRAPGMKSFDAAIEIMRGRETPIRAILRPAVNRDGAIVTLGIAALFLGGGITTAILGDEMMGGLRRDLELGRLSNDDPRLDTGIYLYIAADAAFGLSVIFGGLALYYFLYDPLPASEGTVLEPRDWALAPVIDPVRGTAGLLMEGVF